jgi:hypothetical protein
MKIEQANIAFPEHGFDQLEILLGLDKKRRLEQTLLIVIVGSASASATIPPPTPIIRAWASFKTSQRYLKF